MHKYMHHIGDFMRDTNYLTSLEECFYRRAIDFYYLNEKPLPKETQVVMKRLRAITQEERDALTLVLNDFFILEDDGFHNKRCDSEIAIYQGNADKNRKNGKLGGRPKKINYLENLEKTQVVILENPSESQLKGNQQPTTNNQQPILKENIFSVFNFWKEVFSKDGRTVLKGKRETTIGGRLKEGYTVDEIKQAILNVSVSEYHIAKGYIDIELICRNQINLDKYIAMGVVKKPTEVIEQPQQQVESEWVEF